MSHRSIFRSFCHGVLIVALGSLPCLAGGPEPAKSPFPTFLESVFESRKGTLDVKWKMERNSDKLRPNPNHYKITILSPTPRSNVTLLVDGKPEAYISSHLQTFAFDFTSHGKGEHEVTLVVFDSVSAGASTKTVDVIARPVPKVAPAMKPFNNKGLSGFD